MPVLNTRAASSGRRIASSVVSSGREISGSEVEVPEFERVRCACLTVASPAICESSRAVSTRFGVNATRV